MNKSIQYKILLPFLLLIFIGMVSLIAVLYSINEQNTYQIISDDMIYARQNQALYLKQYFLVNNLEFDSASLAKESDTISRSLSLQESANIKIYPYPIEKESHLSSDKDFSLASNGETAYTIDFSQNAVFATLSFPIQIDDNIIGIMRYSKDYTEHFTNNKNFIVIIGLFSTSILLAMLIISYFISRQLVKPIKRLIVSSEEISKGNYDIDIDIKSKDEIGELACRFQVMANTVSDQIDVIKKDRDRLKEAQEQSKLFFDNVTHELKTPLTTILGYTQVIKENGFNDKAFFDKGTDYIIREGKRLNNLVIEILNLSKANSSSYVLNLQTLNLTNLLRQTCDEMRIESDKYKITIDDDIQDGLIINGDIYQLKKVFTNLIDNSIKYSQANCSEAKYNKTNYSPANSPIKVTAISKNSLVFVTIEDNGIGIPEKDIDNLFEPFYRASNNNSKKDGSTGLGLYIVKSIIEIHGGTIKILSQINQGTEVNISLGGNLNEK